MISLRGKTALITGGSRGIGLAIARAFAFRGASTILVGRNADTLQSAVVSLRETTAGSAEMHQQLPTPLLPSPSSQTTQNFHTSVQGDVCLATTWQDLIRRLEEGDLGAGAGAGAAKRIDVLVNCAGIAQRSLLVKTSPEDVDALLDTNLKSAVLGCKYVGRQMLRSAASFSRSRTPPLSSSSPSSEEGSGNGERAGREEAGLSIINVSSVMASRGGHGASVYAASKAGILGLTSALAMEYGQLGVRVNALVPGYISTDMTENLNQVGLRKNIPLGRMGRPNEVADAAIFLAQNSYANNCVLTIDGGLTAGFSVG